jgi:regulation of enolase protein 1 (concanavalin A-like superfamily)
MYLDDEIGIDPDEQLCQNIANEVKIDLIKSGFVPKAEKSHWKPVKRLLWLGTINDTEYKLKIVSPKHNLFKARFGQLNVRVPRKRTVDIYT